MLASAGQGRWPGQSRYPLKRRQNRLPRGIGLGLGRFMLRGGPAGTGRVEGLLAGRFAGCVAGRFAGCVAGRFAGCVAGRFGLDSGGTMGGLAMGCSGRGGT